MSILIGDLATMDFSEEIDSGAALIPLTHPGDILRHDFMEPLHLTVEALAAALGLSVERLAGVLDKTNAITPDVALRIARYFGTSAELWVGLQTSYDLQEARRELGADIERQVMPRTGHNGTHFLPR